ncbi:MAG: MFS transporter [Promethearchaeota archaeon]
METQKPSKSKFVTYGMPRASSSIVLGIVDTGLLTLYTLGLGVFPFLVGLALGLGKLAIAFSQFFFGWLSDKTRTKIGKRKPYMIICAPILTIIFILLVLPTVFLTSPTGWDLFIWLFILDFLFQFFYGALTTPYQSWVAELFEVNERPDASAFQNLFGFLGTGVGVVFVFIIIPLFNESYESTGQIPLLYAFTSIVFGVLIIILYYICAYILPVETTDFVHSNIFEDIKELIKDRNFMKVCLLQGIAFLAWGMVTPTLLGFVTEVLGFSSGTMAIAAGILFLGIIVFLFTWKSLIDNWGKKKTISLIFLVGVVVLPFSLIGLIPGGVPFGVALIYVLGVAAALGGWYLFPYIWYADLAEDAKRRGDLDEMKAGLYAGFPNILLNIFQFIALVITGLILSLPYVPGKEYSWGYVLWGLWCSGVLLIGFIYIRKYIKLDFEWEKEIERKD